MQPLLFHWVSKRKSQVKEQLLADASRSLALAHIQDCCLPYPKKKKQATPAWTMACTLDSTEPFHTSPYCQAYFFLLGFSS